MKKTSHKIICGDSRSMSSIDDQSVQLIVTSPPYWQLKDYGSDEQLGFNDTYEDYINNMNLVWKECHRVLHDGCRMCINIGDQFARSVYYGRYKVIPIRTEIIRFCETIGFDFMGSIIWQKVTTCNTTGGASIMGSYPNPRNGIIKIDYEFILLFKKQGKAPVVSAEQKEASSMTNEEWNQYFAGHWNFPGEKQSGHLAMFPEELPKRLIKMFSFVGETVLDPFMGSGTTALAATKLGRNSVGYEINQEIIPVIKNKMHMADDIFSQSKIEYSEDSSRPADAAIEKLPYVFSDPLILERKVDPRKLGFGSRVSFNDLKKPDLHKVTAIVSATKIRVNDSLAVRLQGVEPLPGKENDVIEFLKQKVQGKQVILKFDQVKYDDENNLLVYLYLKNRTFINAHLVKFGLAVVNQRYGVTNKSLLKLEKVNA